MQRLRLGAPMCWAVGRRSCCTCATSGKLVVSQRMVCTFQVLGHSKTILVLLGGWAFLGDLISFRQFFGMCIAVLGMVGYGWASSRCASPPGDCDLALH